jgi:hypothetical protein
MLNHYDIGVWLEMSVLNYHSTIYHLVSSFVRHGGPLIYDMLDLKLQVLKTVFVLFQHYF